MPRRVLVQRGETRFDVVERPASNELALQEVVRANPQLLPSDDLGFDNDLVVVGRETYLASGAIDLLCLARTGDLVLVEFKTGPQNPDFRHALAQVIDYGSDLWRSSVEDFDRGVVQRYLSSRHNGAAAAGTKNLNDLIERSTWNLTGEERQILLDRLGEVLATGDFTFVVAAQRFSPQMTASLDYLNTTVRYGRYFLVEVIRLEGADLVAHAAQVVAAPPRKTAGPRSSGGKINQIDFLESLPDEPYREAMLDILTTAEKLGLALAWGSKGISLRLSAPDRAERLSIAWAFPEGTGWSNATHLTLGVDRNSAIETPSVKTAIESYLQQASQVPGAHKISKPDGYTFSPSQVPQVKDQVNAALTDLVAAIQQVGSQPVT